MKLFLSTLICFSVLVACADLPLPPPAPVQQPTAAKAVAKPIKTAEGTLDAILKLFSEGQNTEISAYVDEQMIGYAQFFEVINQASVKQKDIKINLKEKRTTKGKNIMVIQTDWEKRYLELPAASPKLVKGKTLFLFQLVGKNWKLTSQSGDNIFAL